MFNIITAYPLWFLIFCLLTGILYSFILYYKEKNFFGTFLNYTLATMRFLVISILCFLLLSPLLKTKTRQTEKPVIIFAYDNSESIINNKDSSFYKGDFIKQMSEVENKLSNNYDVKKYYFGQTFSENTDKLYKDQQTDLSELFNELKNIYSNVNVGAMVLVSDGIFNSGLDPLYAAKNISFPIYSVALGDTGIQKDIILKNVRHNNVAYIGNNFPVEIIVNAYKAAGNTVKLTINDKDKVIYEKTLTINNNNFSRTIPIYMEAKTTGIQHYKIAVTALKDEITEANNVKDIFVEIKSEKQKVLILAEAPHPDLSALKNAIETNYNYEVSSFVINDFNLNINSFNVIILHQLPSKNQQWNPLIQQIIKAGIPALFIIGSRSDLNTFNSYKVCFSILANKNIFNEVQPVFNDNFTSFTVNNSAITILPQYPPLSSPFANYSLFNSTDILAFQKIGSVKTTKALIAFQSVSAGRYAVIAGEGIWKWRLFNFLQKANHNEFNEIINKTIQYLSVKTDKSRFRIYNSGYFNETDDIVFDAELFNDSYELINEPDINLTITNSKGDKYPYLFSKTEKAYHLSAG
ncbi:MAG: hypothetical protein KA792_10005, partial [Bacteroidales bacterium]|nr:hypothetical protein [Bacteroidales bacterium]